MLGSIYCLCKMLETIVGPFYFGGFLADRLQPNTSFIYCQCKVLETIVGPLCFGGFLADRLQPNTSFCSELSGEAVVACIHVLCSNCPLGAQNPWLCCSVRSDNHFYNWLFIQLCLLWQFSHL